MLRHLGPERFAFGHEVRRIIYTTNAIESLNFTLRKVTKARGHFPNDEAARPARIALDALLKPQTRPNKLPDCRARIEAELSVQLKQVEDILARGDASANAQLSFSGITITPSSGSVSWLTNWQRWL